MTAHRSSLITLTIGCVAALVLARPTLAAPASPASLASPAREVLTGTWRSTQCEPRAGAPFANREYQFGPSAYVLVMNIFNDGRCAVPKYRVRVEGVYRLVTPSPIVPGAWNTEFRPRSVVITPLNTTAADLLNGAVATTCGTQAWYVGAAQDVTPTKGCLVLGYNLRGNPVEYDIARIDGGSLLLGLWPGDGQPPFVPERRPTQFAPALQLQPGPPPDPSTPLLPDTGADLSGG